MTMDLKQSGKILYVASVDLALFNGPAVNEQEFLKALFRALPGRAHAVIPTPSGPVEGLDASAVTFSRSIGHGLPAFLRHQADQVAKAIALLKRERFDLLVTRIRGLHTAELSYITRRHPIPYALKTLGEYALFEVRTQRNPKTQLRYVMNHVRRRALGKVLSKAIAIDVCTAILQEQALKRFALDPAKVKLIDNAVNTEMFCPQDKAQARAACGLEKFDPIVGFVGGRPWERGGMQMVELVPRLLERFPRLGMVIVGGGKGMDALLRRGRELKIFEHCTFAGVVPYARVPQWVNTFDIGVAFDVPARVAMVGNANQKVRQYIACGKPVVASAGGNEFLSSHGLGSVVDVQDLSQIEQALVQWLSLTPSQQQLHAHKASDFAKANLSVEKTLRERLDFWSERLSAL